MLSVAVRHKPDVSVIICTHNPRPVLFEWVLASIEYQTLEPERFEVLVVDNRSAPSLDETRLTGRGRLNLRVVREPRLGLSHARCAGIRAASADLLVFVDDDNHLFPDYLQQSVDIASREPGIGHFGGIALPLHEEPAATWQTRFLPHLGVRDHGPHPITSRQNTWGEWEPIGAGMVTRRPIAEEFVRLVQRSAKAQMLGRQGTRLMSGEDTLFARLAGELGFACSYQPTLRLFHFIRTARMRPLALGGTLLGHGRSYVILEDLSKRRIKLDHRCRRVWNLAICAAYRVRTEGIRAGLIQWCWDLGAFLQAGAKVTDESETAILRTGANSDAPFFPGRSEF